MGFSQLSREERIVEWQQLLALWAEKMPRLTKALIPNIVYSKWHTFRNEIAWLTMSLSKWMKTRSWWSKLCQVHLFKHVLSNSCFIYFEDNISFSRPAFRDLTAVKLEIRRKQHAGSMLLAGRKGKLVGKVDECSAWEEIGIRERFQTKSPKKQTTSAISSVKIIALPLVTDRLLNFVWNSVDRRNGLSTT